MPTANVNVVAVGGVNNFQITLTGGLASTLASNILLTSPSGAGSLAGASPSLTTSASTLSVSGVINSQQVAGAGLTKVGGGTLILNGSQSNTYNALTNVFGGTLQLAMTNGAIAIQNSLTIGDERNPISTDSTTGANSAVVSITTANGGVSQISESNT